MKNMFLMIAALLVASTSAQARSPERPFQGPAVCGLEFTARGGGIQIIVGHFRLRGEGLITCRDSYGNKQYLPVSVQFGGHSPVALKLAIGHMHIAGLATGIGYSRAPIDLAGEYLLANAEAAVGIGAGASVGLHARRHGRDAATLNVKFHVARGLGINVGFTTLSIRPLR